MKKRVQVNKPCASCGGAFKKMNSGGNVAAQNENINEFGPKKLHAFKGFVADTARQVLAENEFTGVEADMPMMPFGGSIDEMQEFGYSPDAGQMGMYIDKMHSMNRDNAAASLNFLQAWNDTQYDNKIKKLETKFNPLYENAYKMDGGGKLGAAFAAGRKGFGQALLKKKLAEGYSLPDNMVTVDPPVSLKESSSGTSRVQNFPNSDVIVDEEGNLQIAPRVELLGNQEYNPPAASVNRDGSAPKVRPTQSANSPRATDDEEIKDVSTMAQEAQEKGAAEKAEQKRKGNVTKADLEAEDGVDGAAEQGTDKKTNTAGKWQPGYMKGQINYRRALLPGNRVKNMVFSFGAPDDIVKQATDGKLTQEQLDVIGMTNPVLNTMLSDRAPELPNEIQAAVARNTRVFEPSNDTRINMSKGVAREGVSGIANDFNGSNFWDGSGFVQRDWPNPGNGDPAHAMLIDPAYRFPNDWIENDPYWRESSEITESYQNKYVRPTGTPREDGRNSQFKRVIPNFKKADNLDYMSPGGVPEVPELNWDDPWGQTEGMRQRAIFGKDWGAIGKRMAMVAPAMGTAIGRAFTEPNMDDEIERLTYASNVFTPRQGTRGFNTFNPTGFNPGNNATPAFAKKGGCTGRKGYQEGGEYEMTEDEIREFLAAGGQIEYVD